jgi:hypothetical protein
MNRSGAHRAIVVVTSHKPVLTPWELISLRQCVRILGTHPMTFICPEGMDSAWYRTFVPEIPIEHVDARWMSSFAMFQAFKISPFLYEKYEDYDYILFYEPDAFVFSDMLEAWCDRDFDYVGAPWVKESGESTSIRMIGGGNGGFSLRKVASHARVAKKFEIEQFLFRGYRRHSLDKLRFILAEACRLLGNGEKRRHYIGPWSPPLEDFFWGFTAPKRDPSFRVAPPELALSFSFEVMPRRLYEINAHRLPFGCHAWFRYDLAFWRPFIEQFGYELPDEPVPMHPIRGQAGGR